MSKILTNQVRTHSRKKNQHNLFGNRWGQHILELTPNPDSTLPIKENWHQRGHIEIIKKRTKVQRTIIQKLHAPQPTIDPRIRLSNTLNQENVSPKKGSKITKLNEPLVHSSAALGLHERSPNRALFLKMPPKLKLKSLRQIIKRLDAQAPSLTAKQIECHLHQ